MDHIRDKGDSTLRESIEEGKGVGIPDGPFQADSEMDIPEQDTNEPDMNEQYPETVAEHPVVENMELPVAEHPVVEDLDEHVHPPETGICRYPQHQRRPPDTIELGTIIRYLSVRECSVVAYFYLLPVRMRSGRLVFSVSSLPRCTCHVLLNLLYYIPDLQTCRDCMATSL